MKRLSAVLPTGLDRIAHHLTSEQLYRSRFSPSIRQETRTRLLFNTSLVFSLGTKEFTMHIFTTILLSLAFISQISAGSLCFSTRHRRITRPSHDEAVAFPADDESTPIPDLWGHLTNCERVDRDEYHTYFAWDAGSVCHTLTAIGPIPIRVCGNNANLVRAENDGGLIGDKDQPETGDPRIPEYGDCGIKLEVNGIMYDGRRLEESNRECDGSCEGGAVYGVLKFEGVPICTY